MKFTPKKTRLALRIQNSEQEMVQLAGADVGGLPGLGAGTHDTDYIAIPDQRTMLDVDAPPAAPPAAGGCKTAEGSRKPPRKRPRGQLQFMSHDARPSVSRAVRHGGE